MHINRRHIIQYKPEGVANIFAPTIRINGRTVQMDNTPSASNDLDFEHVHYPQDPTVSSERVELGHDSLQMDNFNSLFYKMFDNVINEDTTPRPSYTDQSSSYGLGHSNFQGDFAKFFANSLQSQVNCLNNDGNCTPKSECPESRRIGDCSLPNHVCCKDDSPPESYGGSGYQQGAQDDYGNTVTGQARPRDFQSINVDIKYQGRDFQSLTFSQKEEIKGNTRDRYLNEGNANNIILTTDDLMDTEIFQGSVVVRLVFKNNFDNRDKIKKLNDIIRQSLTKSMNIYSGTKRLKAMSLRSTTDSLGSSRSRSRTTVTGPQTSATPQRTSQLPSDMGVNMTFCKQFCGLENKAPNISGEERLYMDKWRPCNDPCKNAKCANCPDSGNYIDPTDTERLIKAGYLESRDAPRQTKFVSGYPKQTKRDDINECYKKSESDCHQSNDCFFCISDEVNKTRKCTTIGTTGKYICEERGNSACLPIYNQGANLKTYNEDPFHNHARFDFTNEKLPEVGKKDVLSYPFQGKCMAPIKRTLSYEDQRELMDLKNPSSRT